MSRFMLLRSLALASFIAVTFTTHAFAHCFVGARFLPATLLTDDPCVADEMSIPTVGWSKTADVPPASQLDISIDFSKRITENFGVTFSQGWTQIRQPDGTVASGFGNLETAFQFQVLKDPSHELAILTGLSVDWGRTGSTGAGFADKFSTITPTINIGKGFGDLPDSVTLGGVWLALQASLENIRRRATVAQRAKPGEAESAPGNVRLQAEQKDPPAEAGAAGTA